MRKYGQRSCFQRRTVYQLLACLLVFSMVITLVKYTLYRDGEHQVPEPRSTRKIHRELQTIQTVTVQQLTTLQTVTTKRLTTSLKITQPEDVDREFENVKIECINGSKHNYREDKEAIVSHYSTFNEVVDVAKAIGTKHKTILVSVINDGYIPFLFSWLCNTREMNIHNSVLVITTDIQTVKVLKRDWPNVNAVAIELNIPPGNQKYSRVGYVKIMVKRAEVLLEILKNKVNFMLTEFDYVWFTNAVPEIENKTGVDILKNPVSTTNGKVSNGGLIYAFATERSLKLWEQLVNMLKQMWIKLEKMANDEAIPESENDQIFFSKLIRERYADIRTGDLPLEKYADGAWYTMPESERNKTKPVMISNNWIIGNSNKMRRAKQWGHWFLLNDCTCDINLVQTTVV